MAEWIRSRFSWEGAAQHYQRIGEANRRADRRWLRSLTVERSIEIFEDLSRGIPELDSEGLPDPPPVPLLRLWRS